MRKLIGALVVAAAALAITAAVATAATSITYTGQGFNANGTLATSDCAAPDNGGTGTTVLPNQQYLLWVLNGTVTGTPVLHIGSNTYTMVKVGSTWKVITPFYSRTTLVSGPTTAFVNGFSGTPNNLVISHGCGTVASHTSTTIHLGADDSAGVVPVTGALPLGSTVHDSATVVLDSPVGIPAGSSVNFTFYNGTDCKGSSIGTSGQISTTSGSVDPSLPEGPLHAGGYGYKAVFTSGNTNLVLNSTGDCEPLTINQGQLRIKTQIHDAQHNNVGGDTHVGLGSVVHDTAKVGGLVAGFDPGAVSFTLNGNPVAQGGTGDAIRTVDSDPLAAGSYTYAASVAGNSDYLGASSDPEPLTVDQAHLSILTTIHDKNHNAVTGSLPLGSVVHDTATVKGAVPGFDPTGAITFTATGTGLSSDQVAPEAGFSATTVDSAPLAAGSSYKYSASVAGDSNYIGATSDDEPLTIDKAQLHISTQIHDASHGNVGGDTHVALGTVVHDTATITGQVDGFSAPGAGDVSFTLNGNPVAQGGTGDPIRTVDSDPLHAGSYNYAAHVDGNSNYLAADSGNEPLTVDRAQLGISTVIHDASHSPIGATVNSGTSLHDTASLTGVVSGFNPGAVSFTLDGNGIASDNGDVDALRSVAVTPLVGDHKFAASVADSGDYLGATSSDEPFSVVAPHAFCSPGFWKNTSDANWALTGYSRTDLFNNTVVPSFYDTPLAGNPTLGDVAAASGNTFGGPSGPFGLNPFNAVGAFLSNHIPGFQDSDGSTAENCPLNNGSGS